MSANETLGTPFDALSDTVDETGGRFYAPSVVMVSGRRLWVWTDGRRYLAVPAGKRLLTSGTRESVLAQHIDSQHVARFDAPLAALRSWAHGVALVRCCVCGDTGKQHCCETGRRECPSCENGVVRHDCPSCAGHPCTDCNGSMSVPCSLCNGSRERGCDHGSPVAAGEVGGVLVNRELVRPLLAALPGPDVVVLVCDSKSGVRFVSGDRVACVMPLDPAQPFKAALTFDPSGAA